MQQTGMEENKMKVGKLIRGLSNSMFFVVFFYFFLLNYMHLNITIHCFLQLNGQLPKFCFRFVFSLYYNLFFFSVW